MHWTTDEKDSRDRHASERRFWRCSKGHESSATAELKRCPAAGCRGKLTEDRRGKRR